MQGLGVVYSSLFLSEIREQSHCPPGPQSPSTADSKAGVLSGEEAELVSSEHVALGLSQGTAEVRWVKRRML